LPQRCSALTGPRDRTGGADSGPNGCYDRSAAHFNVLTSLTIKRIGQILVIRAGPPCASNDAGEPVNGPKRDGALCACSGCVTDNEHIEQSHEPSARGMLVRDWGCACPRRADDLLASGRLHQSYINYYSDILFVVRSGRRSSKCQREGKGLIGWGGSDDYERNTSGGRRRRDNRRRL
jgi:hypothetical protein